MGLNPVPEKPVQITTLSLSFYKSDYSVHIHYTLPCRIQKGITVTEQKDENLKLHIDSDWKAEVEQEKSKLEELDQMEEDKSASGEGRIPPADFRTLMSTLVTPALLYLGGIPDPQTGQAVVSLEMATHYIDLLAVLEEKTKGNLSEEESKELTMIINDLRARFVELSKHIASLPPEAFKQGPATPQTGGGIQTP